MRVAILILVMTLQIFADREVGKLERIGHLVQNNKMTTKVENFMLVHQGTVSSGTGAVGWEEAVAVVSFGRIGTPGGGGVGSFEREVNPDGVIIGSLGGG